MLEKFERIKLGHFPTPIEHLKNISKYLGGPNIFIKRDDCTGLATGGNKTRKLEFLIPDAIKNKAELVVTVGAVQSNHARQTAAACTIMGLKCLIILEQRVKNPPEVYMNSGNVFLDKLYGADIKICPKNEIFLENSEKIIQDLKSNNVKIDKQTITNILTVNGIRFSFKDGSWGLIRASSNKPSLVVVTESPSSDIRKKKIFEFIDKLLNETGKVGEYDQKI